MPQEKQKKVFDIIAPAKSGVARHLQVTKEDASRGAREADTEERGKEILRATASKKSRKKANLPAGRPVFPLISAKLWRALAGKLTGFSSFKSFPGKKILFPALGVILVVSSVVFLYFALPRVEVKITQKSETLNFDMDVRGELGIPVLNSGQNKIPVEIFSQEKELSHEFQSTGKKLNEGKARGVITVYNNYNSSSQTLVKTTRFISQGGQLFRSVATITIPGAKMEGGKITPSSHDVEVIAEESGGEYNIGPSTFSIPGFRGTPKYTAFYGQSKNAMAGGTKGEGSAVSQEDIDKALKILTDQAKQAVEAELKSKIPTSLKIIDEAQETKIIETKKPEIGSAGAKFTIGVKAISRALVFNENDIQRLIDERTGKDLIPKEKEGLPKSLVINYTLNKFPDFDKGILDLKLKIEQKIIWKIDINALKRELAGKDEAGIRGVLSKNPAIEKAQVTLWPFWVKQAPKDQGRIKIEL